MNKPPSPFITLNSLEEDAPRCAPQLEPRLAEDQAADLAAIFKAISHPVRLQMLDLIAQGGGQACICDLEGYFNLTQPTLSHHVKVLREAGLIQSEQNQVWIFHRVRPETLHSIRDLLNQWIGSKA